jgi:hypothetical protein
MLDEREPSFIAAVGTTGVGKTFQNLLQALSVLMGNPSCRVIPRKVLFIDNNQEYHNENADVKKILCQYGYYIKTIHYKQVPAFSRQVHIEACRIIPIDDHGQLLSGKEFGKILNWVLNNFRNGLIVAEDFRSYTGSHLNDDLIARLITRRHTGCDTLLSLQDINLIHPNLLAVLKWIRLHKSLDNLTRTDKFTGKLALISIANNIVNNRYKLGGDYERSFVKINTQQSVIRGYYTADEFSYAAQQYIFENYAQTVGKRLAWRDIGSGKKKFDDRTALRAVMDEYTNQYSQYSPRNKEQ